MPYITKEKREVVDRELKPVIQWIEYQTLGDRDGILNYLITRLLHELYPTQYFDLNRAMGVLESCKQEFYRKVVANYEDKKEKENGEIK